MLISGDFRQLLPVIEKGNMSAIVNHTITKSALWDNVETLKYMLFGFLHLENATLI